MIGIPSATSDPGPETTVLRWLALALAGGFLAIACPGESGRLLVILAVCLAVVERILFTTQVRDRQRKEQQRRQ